MRFVKEVILIFAFFFHNAASLKASDCDNPRKDFAFHEEAMQAQDLKPTPIVTGDIEIFVELIGIPNTAKINELNLQIRRATGPGINNNALGFESRGCRTIVFDPHWASGDTPGFYLILSHEAGHQFCGHTVSQVRRDRMELELEADEFSGASIRRYEIYHNRNFFDQVYAAAIAKYPENGSSTYPPRALRLEAIKRGYELGSQCGDLAPVTESGYSPPQRSWGAAKPCRPVQTGPTSYTCAD